MDEEYPVDVDQLWVDLDRVAEQKKLTDKLELQLIRQARSEGRTFRWIADVLRLPSEDAAMRRYQYLSNREIGIPDVER